MEGSNQVSVGIAGLSAMYGTHCVLGDVAGHRCASLRPLIVAACVGV